VTGAGLEGAGLEGAGLGAGATGAGLAAGTVGLEGAIGATGSEAGTVGPTTGVSVGAVGLAGSAMAVSWRGSANAWLSGRFEAANNARITKRRWNAGTGWFLRVVCNWVCYLGLLIGSVVQCGAHRLSVQRQDWAGWAHETGFTKQGLRVKGFEPSGERGGTGGIRGERHIMDITDSHQGADIGFVRLGR
jgi:hypothetical protein